MLGAEFFRRFNAAKAAAEKHAASKGHSLRDTLKSLQSFREALQFGTDHAWKFDHSLTVSYFDKLMQRNIGPLSRAERKQLVRVLYLLRGMLCLCGCSHRWSPLSSSLRFTTRSRPV